MDPWFYQVVEIVTESAQSKHASWSSKILQDPMDPLNLPSSEKFYWILQSTPTPGSSKILQFIYYYYYYFYCYYM